MRRFARCRPVKVLRSRCCCTVAEPRAVRVSGLASVAESKSLRMLMGVEASGVFCIVCHEEDEPRSRESDWGFVRNVVKERRCRRCFWPHGRWISFKRASCLTPVRSRSMPGSQSPCLLSPEPSSSCAFGQAISLTCRRCGGKVSGDPNFHRQKCVGLLSWYLPKLGGTEESTPIPLAVSDRGALAFICLCTNCLNVCRASLEARKGATYRYFDCKQRLREHVLHDLGVWCGSSAFTVRPVFPSRSRFKACPLRQRAGASTPALYYNIDVARTVFQDTRASVLSSPTLSLASQSSVEPSDAHASIEDVSCTVLVPSTPPLLEVSSRPPQKSRCADDSPGSLTPCPQCDRPWSGDVAEHADVECLFHNHAFIPGPGGVLSFVPIPLVLISGGHIEWMCLCTACASCVRGKLEADEDVEYETFINKDALRRHMAGVGGMWLGLDAWQVREPIRDARCLLYCLCRQDAFGRFIGPDVHWTFDEAREALRARDGDAVV